MVEMVRRVPRVDRAVLGSAAALPHRMLCSAEAAHASAQAELGDFRRVLKQDAALVHEQVQHPVRGHVIAPPGSCFSPPGVML